MGGCRAMVEVLLRKRQLPPWMAGLLAAAICVLTPTSARGGEAPFFRYYEGPLRFTYALEMMAARLQVVDRYLADLEADEPTGSDGHVDETERAEPLEEAVEQYFPLLAGSLESRSVDLFAALDDALARVLVAAEGAEDSEPGDLEGAVERALEALERARGMLVPRELEEDPAFVAQLIQMLLLTEDGVAEAFEEFMEGSPGEYLEGWAVLQRAKGWWARIRSVVTGNHASVDEPLQELDGLFPSPVPPTDIVEDPEAAEEVAHRIVAALEEVTGVPLYPERDLGRIALLTRSLVAAGCEANRSGNGRLAREHLFAARFAYEQYLADAVEVLEPDLHERIVARLAGLTDDEDSAEACDELLSDIDELARLFGPQDGAGLEPSSGSVVLAAPRRNAG